MVLLNRDQIMKLIPHREPFLLIDEIIALEPGVKCIALKHLSTDDFWVPGHFPQLPVTPGVLMIEMLAQTGAVCIGAAPEYNGKIALFAKLDKAKFRRQVVPGETLTLEIEMLRLRGKAGIGRGLASVDGERAVSCDITFAFDS